MANMSHNKTSLAFKANSANIGSVATPYLAQAFTAPTPASATVTNVASNESVEPFNFSNYYSISENDVMEKISLLMQKITETDFTDLTNLEAYDFVENQFKDAFGDNFLLAFQLRMTSWQTTYVNIGQSFNQALNHVFGSEGKNVDVIAVNRERLFGDASDDEIYDAIRAKYPETLTYRDVLSMYHEMKSVGLLNENDKEWLSENKKGYDTLNLIRAVHELGFWSTDISWEVNIHKSVSTSHVFGWYNMFQWHEGYEASPMLKEFMTMVFGGEFDEEGWLKGGVMPWSWNNGDPDRNQMLSLFTDINIDRMRIPGLSELLSRSKNSESDQLLGINREIRRESNFELSSNTVMFSMFSEISFKQWFKGIPTDDNETPVNMPGGGITNTSVFKAESSTEDNPVFLVKGTYSDGTPFEGEVNIYSIDPRNASFIEMLALDGYFMAKEQMVEATWIAAQAMREIGGLSGPEHDAFTKYDFIYYLQQMKERHLLNDNKDTYSMYENVIDSLLDFITQRES